MPAAGSPSLKRKRVVESCSECYRRKQKPEMCQPNVLSMPQSKCLPMTLSLFTKSLLAALTIIPRVPPPEGIRHSSMTTNQWGQEPSPLQDDRVSPHLGSNALGYSSAPGSNAFVGLQQILGNAEFDRINSSQTPASNPSVSRHTNQVLLSKLPPRPVLQTLIDLFFTEVNWHYFILDRFYFDDLFSRWPISEELEPVGYLSLDELSRELCYFPAVLFQVTCLTLQFLPSEQIETARVSANDLANSQSYSDIGDQLLSNLGRPGAALSGVQAEFLRASCLKNAGRGTEAWHALGNAIRQAQELGLHRHREIRQREEASIDKTLCEFCLMAMILGRPRMIHRDDCDAKPPMECSIPKNPSVAIPMAVRSDESPGIIPVSASLFQYAIACKVHDMRAIKVDRPHPKTYSTVQKIHEDVDSMMEGLLPAIRPDCPDTSWDLELPYLPQLREELKVMANLFIVNLHRPHIIASTESRKAALQAAITTLDSQLRSFTQTNPHQYRLFGLAFYLVDASFLLSIISILYPPENSDARQNIETSLSRSLDSLAALKIHNPIAKAGFDVVQRCYKKLKEAFQLRRANDASGPHPALHGSSTTRLQSLMRDLQDHSLEPSMGSLLDPDQSTQTPNLGLPTPPFYGLQDSFDSGYWLEQLNQIQPSLLFEQDPNGMWETLSFD
ncbi:hypothetical protein N7508_006829 [Penicillium antarcticum]|uniref:uncharacterized protein n=1 Tax=Penicillium antarcticum TaxID=416450 RepID=UPI00239CD364|nr:uncharacterized protein N7508_006829 [Penicillium antarcticum]KAJ5301966.1 hypothetical protein N7508_006829 [Penicillium antarcticum]